MDCCGKLAQERHQVIPSELHDPPSNESDGIAAQIAEQELKILLLGKDLCIAAKLGDKRCNIRIERSLSVQARFHEIAYEEIVKISEFNGFHQRISRAKKSYPTGIVRFC